jgi:hypothetical protein
LEIGGTNYSRYAPYSLSETTPARFAKCPPCSPMRSLSPQPATGLAAGAELPARRKPLGVPIGGCPRNTMAPGPTPMHPFCWNLVWVVLRGLPGWIGCLARLFIGVSSAGMAHIPTAQRRPVNGSMPNSSGGHGRAVACTWDNHATGNNPACVLATVGALRLVQPVNVITATGRRIEATHCTRSRPGSSRGQGHDNGPCFAQNAAVAGIQAGRNLAPKLPNQRECWGEFITVTLKKSENTENKPQKAP